MSDQAPAQAFIHDPGILRLGEFDIGGVLYHARYFHLFESAREALLASIDLPYASLVEQGCHLAIAESHQEFLQPITYGQAIKTALWTTDLKRSSVVFNYHLCDTTTGALLHRAWTRSVFVANTDNGFRPTRFLEPLASAFSELEAKA